MKGRRSGRVLFPMLFYAAVTGMSLLRGSGVRRLAKQLGNGDDDITG